MFSIYSKKQDFVIFASNKHSEIMTMKDNISE